VNILLTGAAGQLGSELLPLLSEWGEVTATDRSEPADLKNNWLKADISDGGEPENLLNRLRPGLIVNTAAYTAVDQAESEPQTSFDINADFPGRLAAWAKKNNARLIHYSTDYVFDGNAARPYVETDTPDPLNVYGDSKLAGERAIAESGCEHVILRTSWVYSSHGKNFVLTMLDLARRGLSLKVVDDQTGCPTSARNLAQASISVIREWQASGAGGRTGVFHYCDDSTLSWHDFARAIFSFSVSAGLLEKEPELAPVSGLEFPQPATRPNWSVLDTSKIANVFNIRPASFSGSLQAVIREVRARGLK
jgi:dTDP-4-dehydrorhamnose reductase